MTGDGDVVGDSDHVGPIVFSNETARRQLQQNGEVVTFRPSDRTVGDTWWRKSRTGEKVGDCTVEKIGPANPRLPCSRMEENARLSGFRSVSDWVETIEDLHGTVPRHGYLYRVRIDETWAECEAEDCNEYSPQVQAFGHSPHDFIYLCPDCNNHPVDTDSDRD